MRAAFQHSKAILAPTGNEEDIEFKLHSCGEATDTPHSRLFIEIPNSNPASMQASPTNYDGQQQSSVAAAEAPGIQRRFLSGNGSFQTYSIESCLRSILQRNPERAIPSDGNRINGSFVVYRSLAVMKSGNDNDGGAEDDLKDVSDAMMCVSNTTSPVPIGPPPCSPVSSSPSPSRQSRKRRLDFDSPFSQSSPPKLRRTETFQNMADAVAAGAAAGCRSTGSFVRTASPRLEDTENQNVLSNGGRCCKRVFSRCLFSPPSTNATTTTTSTTEGKRYLSFRFPPPRQ